VASTQVLIGAGWRVGRVTDAARLATAWQELHRSGPVGGTAAVPSSVPAAGAAAGTGTDRGLEGSS